MATLVIELRGEQAERTAKRLQQEIRKIGAEARRTDREVDKVERTAGGFAGTMKGMAVQLGLAVTATVALRKAFVELRESVTAFTEFEASMTRINTLVGINQEKLDEWEPTLREIGATTGKTSTEMSEALFAITSAGLRGAEALDVLRASAQAGAVGLGETNQIARASVAAMTAFGDQGLTAGQAVDTLVATVREGNLEASELAPVLGRVNATAAAMGVTFADVGAFVAGFTRQGVNADEAVTALRAGLNLVLNPADNVRKAMKELGVDLDEVRRTMTEEGLAQGFGMLTEATKGNLDAIGELIPNVRALSGIMGTVGTDLEGMIAIQESIRNSTGITSDGFETWGNTSEAAFAQFSSAADDLKIAIGEELTPVIVQLVKELTAIVENKDAIVGALGAIWEAMKLVSGIKIGEWFAQGMQAINLMPTPEETQASIDRFQALLDGAGLTAQVEIALGGGTGAMGSIETFVARHQAQLDAVVGGYSEWNGAADEVMATLEAGIGDADLAPILRDLQAAVDSGDNVAAAFGKAAAELRAIERSRHADALAKDLEAAEKRAKALPGALADALDVLRELRREAEQLDDLEGLGMDQLWERATDDARGMDTSALTDALQDSLAESIDNAFSDAGNFAGMEQAIIDSGSIDNALAQVTDGVIASGTEEAAKPQRLKKIGENVSNVVAGAMASALVMALQGQDWEAVGSSIGGAIGTAIGSAYGPGGSAAGGAIGSLVGGLFGGMLDGDDKLEEERAAYEKFIDDVRSTFDSARQEVIKAIDSVVEWLWAIGNSAGPAGLALEAIGNELTDIVESLTGIEAEDYGSRLAAAVELFATLPDTVADVVAQVNSQVGEGYAEGSTLEGLGIDADELQAVIDDALGGLDLSSFTDQLIQEFMGVTQAIDLGSLKATADALRDAIRGAGFSAEVTAQKLAMVNQAYRDQVQALRVDALMPLLNMMQRYGVFENESRREQAKLMKIQAKLELRLIEAQIEALGIMDRTLRKWIDALGDAIKEFDFEAALPELNISAPDVTIPDNLSVDVGNVVQTETTVKDRPDQDPVKEWWKQMSAQIQDAIAKWELDPLQYATRQLEEQWKWIRKYAKGDPDKIGTDAWKVEQAFAEALRDLTEKFYAPIRDLRDSLLNYGQSQANSFTGAQSEFFSLAADVRGGDLESIQDLAAAGGDYAAAIEDMFGGTRTGRLLIEQMEETLSDILGAAGVDDPEFAEQQEQTSYLSDIRDLLAGADPMIVMDEQGDLHQLRLTTEDANRLASEQRTQTVTTIQDTQATTHGHLVELIEEVRSLRRDTARRGDEVEPTLRARYRERPVGDLT